MSSLPLILTLTDKIDQLAYLCFNFCTVHLDCIYRLPVSGMLQMRILGPVLRRLTHCRKRENKHVYSMKSALLAPNYCV